MTETRARLKEARAREEEALETARQATVSAEQWKEYALALERVLELAGAQTSLTNQPHLTQDHLIQQSTWENIKVVSASNKGLLVVVDAVSFLVDMKVFKDREQARNAIYSTLYSRKNHVERVRQGVYRILDMPMKKMNARTKPKEQMIGQQRKGRVPGLREAILQLKTQNPDMTKKDVLTALLDKAFDFHGAPPRSSVHLAWVNMGYNRQPPVSLAQQAALVMEPPQT